MGGPGVKHEIDKNSRFLMEHEGEQLLRTFGLPVVEGELAVTKEEAAEIASRLGYPVVLKGMSPQIIHKADAGVVKTNIMNQTQLYESFDEIVSNARRYHPSAEIAGVLVQRMVPKGHELIIGVKKDVVFGHQLLIGIGGIWVELMKDVALCMMPVSEEEVDTMVKSLKGYPLLAGYRGSQKIDFMALKEMVKNLNAFIAANPEIEEMDLNPVIFHNNQVVICDVRILMGQSDESKKLVKRSLAHIDKLMNPQSIAVVGASTNEKKSGGRLFRYIVENDYSGRLYPINPKADTIKGFKAYRSLKDIPDEIDLVCIIVDALQVPSVLEECIEKNVKAAVIFSSGFAEIGGEGKDLQEKIVALAQKGNIRLLGPNSIGIASPSKNIYTAFGSALDASPKIPGHIGFISQSGAMGSALLSRAWEQGAGFSRWISVGNEADLTISDFIEVLADDDLTKVIAVFMEGIKDLAAFKEATKKAQKNRKPVLIFKTGKSSLGKRAVQSHTGSIAGDDEVYSAAFDKLGVLRLKHIEDLIDVSRALEIQPIPKGNRVGVITASGGACSVIADLCAEYGLELPALEEKSTLIKTLIPPFGSAQNPIDVTAEIIAKPEMFKKVLEIVVDDKRIDGVIVMMTTNADPGATVIAQAILDVFKKHYKPIVVGRLGADMIAPHAMKLYQQERFPVYPTPERVVKVMHYLVKYSQILQRNKENND